MKKRVLFTLLLISFLSVGFTFSSSLPYSDYLSNIDNIILQQGNSSRIQILHILNNFRLKAKDQAKRAIITEVFHTLLTAAPDRMKKISTLADAGVSFSLTLSGGTLDVPYISGIESYDIDKTVVKPFTIISHQKHLKVIVSTKNVDGSNLFLGKEPQGENDLFRMVALFGDPEKKNIQRQELVFPAHYNNEKGVITFDMVNNQSGNYKRDFITFMLVCQQCDGKESPFDIDYWEGDHPTEWTSYKIADIQTFEFIQR